MCGIIAGWGNAIHRNEMIVWHPSMGSPTLKNLQCFPPKRPDAPTDKHRSWRTFDAANRAHRLPDHTPLLHGLPLGPTTAATASARTEAIQIALAIPQGGAFRAGGFRGRMQAWVVGVVWWVPLIRQSLRRPRLVPSSRRTYTSYRARATSRTARSTKSRERTRRPSSRSSETPWSTHLLAHTSWPSRFRRARTSVANGWLSATSTRCRTICKTHWRISACASKLRAVRRHCAE